MYQNIKLFAGIGSEEMHGLLDCISAYKKSYKRGEFLLLAGDKVASIGIVISGAVNVVKESITGDRRIMMTAEENDIFAESAAAAEVLHSPVSVIAKQDCTILFVPIDRLLFTCGNSCDYHNRLIHNLVAILASKNLFLNQKIDYLSAKNTREKIAKFLGDFISIKKSTTVTLPYNRNDLAEYLGVDRSVLSRELSKLKKEGILDFDKNTFTILKPETLAALYS
ncbi:MAG: Crp/Fnr family transcriptional regulator [Clostridia bacterium]|jgi:CRP/FNR family transcriptional regulator, dissimilatory nitrate respiration regulator|nr:Crp/Fnr family transcriptional regulator [Clostridia bacterium]MBT7122142.1 Crp/Fnr family transcriptional regulator [Clostridia bacterium]